MSRIQLPIVKSFRVSLCEQPPKKIFLAGTPKGVGKVCLKFPASAGRLAIVWETSLPALAGKLQTHFSNPFWGPSKNFFFGGCSQRLTLKDFTIGSCIRDILLHMSYANEHHAEGSTGGDLRGISKNIYHISN